MPSRVPNLRGKLLVGDAGHFAQQEQSDVVNEALIGFLRSEVGS